MPSSGCGRQAVALCELTRLLVSDFFRIIPVTTSRLICSSRQVVARVCCFLRFCIKPIRYIYHPQLDCYLVAVNSDCSHPCELTHSRDTHRKFFWWSLLILESIFWHFVHFCAHWALRVNTVCPGYYFQPIIIIDDNLQKNSTYSLSRHDLYTWFNLQFFVK